jgi:hypothetical protein
LAWGQTRVNINAGDGSLLSSQLLPHGWSAGLGMEMAGGGKSSFLFLARGQDSRPSLHGSSAAAGITNRYALFEKLIAKN